jgi:hypothetical protein
VSSSGEFFCSHFKNDAVFSRACDGSTRLPNHLLPHNTSNFKCTCLSALIEKLGRDVEDSHDLIRDEVYQEQIESKLKMIIDRHCDFIHTLNTLL